MKWVVGVFCLLLLFLIGYVAYARMVSNPAVLEELRTNPLGERAAKAMILTFPDGRALPVNYLRDGAQVFVGADGPWWRVFRNGNVPVTLEIQGERLQGKAQTILDDPAYTEEIFQRLRPNVPDWLPSFLDAYLVVITLEV